MTAAAVFSARTGQTKDQIAALLSDRFGYDCSVGLSRLQARGGFDVTCQGTVPAAAVAFLESTGFEDAVRNAISLGGDADTLACIAGAMAEAHYGQVPAPIQTEVLRRLDDALRAEVLAFASQFGVPLADVHELQEGKRRCTEVASLQQAIRIVGCRAMSVSENVERVQAFACGETLLHVPSYGRS